MLRQEHLTCLVSERLFHFFAKPLAALNARAERDGLKQLRFRNHEDLHPTPKLLLWREFDPELRAGRVYSDSIILPRLKPRASLRAYHPEGFGHAVLGADTYLVL